MGIKENYLKIKSELPEYVKIIVAAKLRTPEEVKEAIFAGAEFIGENYVQEAERVYNALGEVAKRVRWHFIGILQKNKINKILNIFDLIQTVDSYEVAESINKRAEKLNKSVPVFIEINIGSEITKAGVRPDYEAVKELAINISRLKYLKLEGLMTMGPLSVEPQSLRVYFRKTKEFFERLKSLNFPNINMQYLSMGMSDSYKIAIEEGANMIRLGTAIFGKRIGR